MRHVIVVFFAAILVLTTGPRAEASPDEAVQTAHLLQIGNQSIGNGAPLIDVHMGDDLTLTFDAPPPMPLVLVLDNREIPGAVFHQVVDNPKQILVSLERMPQNDDVWRRVLGERREVSIAVGREEDAAAGKLVAGRVRFRSSLAAVALSIGLLVLYAIVAVVGIRGGMLRDAGRGTSLSLGRCQMFLWTTLIVSAFLLLWTTTGSADTVTSQSLVLMGISGVTAMGATVIGSSKNATAIETITGARRAGADPTAAISGSALAPHGFIQDLLYDANGLALHRFQVALWTLILAVIFVVDVVKTLAMPQFSDTLLALMGISGLTYVGFKIPEA